MLMLLRGGVVVGLVFLFLRTPYPKRTFLMWKSRLFHTRVISIEINNTWLAKRKPFISHGKKQNSKGKIQHANPRAQSNQNFAFAPFKG